MAAPHSPLDINPGVCVFFLWCAIKRTLPTAVMMHPRMIWPTLVVFAFAGAGQISEDAHWYMAEEVSEFASYSLLLLIALLNGLVLPDERFPRLGMKLSNRLHSD